MPAQDQVVWAEANVMVGDGLANYKRDTLLPEPLTAGEIQFRQTLRLLGAIRLVEVIYMPGEPGYVAPAEAAEAAPAVAANGTPPPAEGTPAAAGPVIVGAEDDVANTKGGTAKTRPAAKS